MNQVESISNMFTNKQSNITNNRKYSAHNNMQHADRYYRNGSFRGNGVRSK